MVKPDVKVNYYAALELPNTATEDEIKTQFRKLALRYHPDRNPGKEEEITPKFQAINAAYEVLSDSAAKPKYDADRRRAGLYAGAATTSKPPTPGPRTNAFSAANTGFAPPPRRTNDPTDWGRKNPRASGQNMPNGADRFANFPKAPTSKKDSEQERTSAFNAWQYMNTGRKPQQAQSQPKPPPVPQRPRPPPPPRADTRYPSEEQIRAGMSYKQGPSPDEPRSAWAQSNAANGSRPGMSRTASVRTPRKTGFDPNAPGSDERPAGTSTNYASRREVPPPPPFPPPPKQPPMNGNVFAQAQSSPRNQDVHFAEGTRERTPYTSASHEKTYFSSEQLKRSNSTRDTTKLNTSSDPQTPGRTRHRSASPLKPTGDGTKARPFVAYSSSESSDEGSSATTSPAQSAKQAPSASEDSNPFLRNLNRPIKTPNPPSRRANMTSMPKVAPDTSANDFSKDSGASETANDIKFTMPIHEDTFQETTHSKSRSEENINTAFSGSFSGTFTGGQFDDMFTPPPTGRTASPLKRGRDTLSARGSRSQMNTPRSQMPPPPPLSTSNSFATNANEPMSAPPDGKFTPDVWKNSEWDFTPGGSPIGGTRAQPPRRASETAAKTQSSSQSASVPAGDAMDIDSTPAPTQQTAEKSARAYAVPPSKWRQSQGGTPSTRRRSSAATANNGGVNLSDLASTLNGTTATGIEGMHDMTSSLPFQSKASATHPTRPFSPISTSAPLPSIPRAPEPPIRLTKTTWKSYVTSTSSYFTAFHNFNKDMHVRFQGNLAHEAILAGMGPEALEATGQVGEVGLNSYSALLSDEERYRELWSLAGEKHREAIRVFQGVKERVRKLTEDGALADN